ncbi:50S ribosomal protein L11 methyltransferase [Virgibacillus soli]|uniref:50S ribosomal protein L11 methyltransferase n=1 Tax=Paracerasibacillus soli TaxID=480284 RepID=UPI0035EAB766
MKWTEVCIHTTNEAVEAVSNMLNERGASGVAIEDSVDLHKERHSVFGEIFELNPHDFPEAGVRVKAYFASNSELPGKIEDIKQNILLLKEYGLNLGEGQITCREIDEENWATAWKKYYHTTKITDRLTINPSWIDYEKENEEEVVIQLDPGMAFGTGTHATTTLCLSSIEKYLKKDDTVIDVGCGSGILSIASLLLGAKQVHAFDLDDVAVKSTKQNAQMNDIGNNLYVSQNNLLQGVRLEADVIVANILADIIVKLIPDAWDNLKQSGYFITSGIIQEKKSLVEKTLQDNGFSIVEINEEADWVSIVAKK